MATWKRLLIGSLVGGSALTLAVVFLARQGAAEWIGPAFVIPFHGAALLSGNSIEPPPWLFHTVLFVQCYLVVLALGWLAGRYRSRPVNV